MTNDVNPAQYKVLQCGKCLGTIFLPFQGTPCLQDRLDPKTFAMQPRPVLVCAGCWSLFDPEVAGGIGNQEILPA